MRFVIQRVTRSSVSVDGTTIGKIGKGFLVLIGISQEDTQETADRLVKKMTGLRIFEDENGKTNLSLADVGGALLLISQFTLYANCKKGRRPSFDQAARPEIASPLYDAFNDALRQTGLVVKPGIFGAEMKIRLLNDGPVTLILDSNELF